MYVLLCFLAAALMYSVLSWITYSQSFRNTWLVFPVTWLLTISTSTLWVLLVRHLNDTRKIITATLWWDLMLTAIYSVLPLMLADKKVSPQAFLCLAVAVAAIIAFKFYS